MTSVINTTVTNTVTLGTGTYTGAISITGSGAIDVTTPGAVALYDPSSQTAVSIINNGSILAGTGGTGSAGLLGLGGAPGGTGGDGVDLKGAGATITSTGAIAGGAGGSGASEVVSVLNLLGATAGGTGGIGLYGQAATADVTNSGTLAGGAGGEGGANAVSLLGNDAPGAGGNGGAALVIDATADRFGNTGIVLGGTGGIGGTNLIAALGAAGTGGNGGTGAIVSGGGYLDNAASIAGGTGGAGGYNDILGVLSRTGIGGAGGTGVYLDGGTLLNAGTIGGGAGGIGATNGATGDAIVFGSIAATLIADAGAVFTGAVAANSAVADVLDLAGTSAVALAGLGTSFTGFNDITFATGASRTLSGDAAGLAAGQTIAGFSGTDVLDLTGFGATSASFVTGTGLVLSNGVTTETLDLLGTFTTADFTVSSAGNTTEIALSAAPCYLAGTMIETKIGAVRVECLEIGDLVRTLNGSFKPIKWIGRRNYSRVAARANPRTRPIRFRAGALADGIPRRDLLVSADHALYLSGVLIPAASLVNGVSVLIADDIDPVNYVHIELETHEMIFAEGAAAESFVDCDSRMLFQNVDTFRTLYPQDSRPSWAFCAPRHEGGLQVEHIRRAIAVRAGIEQAPVPGPLIGFVDLALRNRITGWAIDQANPAEPVELELLDGEALIMRFLAQSFRQDIVDAGLGDGCAGFDLALPIALAPDQPHELHIRRVSDHHELTGSPVLVPPLSTFGDARDALSRITEIGLAAAATVTEFDAMLNDLTQAMQSVRGRRMRAAASPASRNARPRHGSRRALVIDDTLPDARRDAGSNAILSHMASLRRLGFQVEFVPATPAIDPTLTAALTARGILVHGLPAVSTVEDALRGGGTDYDLIYLHRLANAEAYAGMARRHCPHARLVYAVADLHWLRLARQAALEQWPALADQARSLRMRDFMAMRMVDAVITHSPVERNILLAAMPELAVQVVPWEVAIGSPPAGFGARSGVGFVGHFGHMPNLDAVDWLIDQIMPLVWQAAPDIKLKLAGSAVPSSLIRWAGRIPQLELCGQVEDLAGFFDGIRLSVAPLRFGAGIKGKVLDSLAAGLPCVMSPVAAEGLALPPDLVRLIGGDAGAIATAILDLHTNETAFHQAALAGQGFIAAGYGAQQVDPALAKAAAPVPARVLAA
ncbi:Hint domain-containing protein [Acidiphilium acidophilum]|uniref:Hint domain-containing protein n=1 Tax=Acidiphilium acidophilum TaxID=76588 RepID=UPI002E8E61C5|nr:Hint domain-containing protein [Acidiphilium acidophilum]